MADDLQDIQRVVQTYLDGMYEGDTTKLAQAFHEVAHLFGVEDGALADMSRAEWLDRVRSRPSPQSRDLKRDDRVVQIDRSGPDTAFVKVQCQIPPRYFTDYLTLARLATGWKVVSKTYHTETRA